MTLATASQMLGAEVLKLRRNRALLGFALLLTVGFVVIYFGFLQIQHVSNPARYSPAGGLPGFSHAVRVLGLFFGALAAILIGTEAGTADLSSGVFRDLVSTGRSRLSLFFVRAPAAILVTLACSAAAFAITVVAAFAFAGSQPEPSLSLILQSGAWVALCNATLAALAVAVGSLTGSRAITLTAVIGWQAIVTQLLMNVSSLGSVRDALLTPALGQLMPVQGTLPVTMATGMAVAVLAGWILIPAALGAWRTRTQDA
jgi:ABC-type transport system involved in multi-copper enzyme maturation permease subunit